MASSSSKVIDFPALVQQAPGNLYAQTREELERWIVGRREDIVWSLHKQGQYELNSHVASFYAALIPAEQTQVDAWLASAFGLTLTLTLTIRGTKHWVLRLIPTVPAPDLTRTISE